MSKLKEQILILRSKGKTYNEIKDHLKCSKGTIAYYCGKEQKQKALHRQRINRQKQHPYLHKIQRFKSNINKKQLLIQHKSTTKQLFKSKLEFFAHKHGDKSYMKAQFTLQDVINKFGENPTCYLTGKPIDIYKPRTYEFDHIIPRSRGGDNSLNNLGICTKQANQAKRNMTPDEFINLCKQVLEHAGHTII